MQACYTMAMQYRSSQCQLFPTTKKRRYQLAVKFVGYVMRFQTQGQNSLYTVR